MIEVKIEHDKCKKGELTSLGIMFEITAPQAPVVENATPRKRKALVFVVDRSGSMAGGRLEMVKSTILDTIPRLDPEDYLSVVSFDDDTCVEVPLRKVKAHDTDAIRKVIANIMPGGSTNLEAGYLAAVEEAKKAPRGVEANLIVLSDGHANAGNSDPAALGQIAAAAIEHFVTTSTIGIGEGYDENILDAMSDKGQGNHLAALELAEAIAGLQSEIDNLLQKTMTDVRFEIVLGQDLSGRKSRVHAARTMRKFEHRNGVTRATLGDLASGEEKNAVFEIVLDAHPLANPGFVRGLVLTYEYFDVASGQKVTKTREFDIEIVAEDAWVEPKRDEDIVGELKAVRLKLIREQAWELYQQGREAEADALLKQAGIELEEWMQNANNLSARQQLRMKRHVSDMSSFAMMDDINIKRKRLKETENRTARDRGDFRDKL
jgi:Ca-activated chloride channel family protein